VYLAAKPVMPRPIFSELRPRRGEAIMLGLAADAAASTSAALTAGQARYLSNMAAAGAAVSAG